MKKVDQLVGLLNKAMRAYAEWVRKGRLVNENGSPNLDRPSSYSVVKFLLPRIDIKGELKLKDFGTIKKCTKWLGEIGRGMMWDKHMEVVVEESRAELGAPLFEMGEV
jgi:hypothetical protein